MNNEQLRALHEAAGDYPTLKAVMADGVFTCPLCQGQGEIEAECVREGTSLHGTGLNVSIVGVQIYGFGHGMDAMEKLVPAMINELPRLLQESDELRALKAAHAALLTT
jgi:hypothetical protein